MSEYDPEKLLEAWDNPPNGCSVRIKAQGRMGSITHVTQMYNAAPLMAEDLIAARKAIAALTAERDHARSSVLRLSAMEWAAKAAREERDAALAERDALRAEVAVLRATGRVTADDLITVCMGDCGAITEEDSEGCCAGCGNDTALVVGIGSSEAVLEAFEARERRHGPRRVTP